MSTFIQIAKRFMAKQLKVQDKGREEAELAKLLLETYNRGVRDGQKTLRKDERMGSHE